jgi:putative ABC transport system substrate-binding protein
MWTIALSLVLTLGLPMAPLAAVAPPAKVPQIGVLSSITPPPVPDWKQHSPFLQGLGELGWVEGQTLAIEWRWAERSDTRLRDFASELVQLRVDVLVAWDSGAIAAAKEATDTIPIVMTVSGDPVRAGFVASLARPGGNITGLSNISPQLAGKRLELLIEAVRGVTRVAILGPPAHPDWAESAVAAQPLGVQLHALKVQQPEEFETAFAAATQEGTQAIIVLPSPLTNPYRRRFAQLAAKYGLPAMFALKEYVEVGGLMSYGPSIPALYRRAATYVDKLLKGAKPSDLPVEQPTTFEFVFNLKTAQALGLTISPMLLFQADEVLR